VTTTSFFPAKPLGCYGDGGAILTDDETLALTIDSLRIHGKGEDKYDNVRIGMNSRLDTLQAAILLEKLSIFKDEIQDRDRIASRYISGLKDIVTRVPTLLEGAKSTWAQFTIEVEDAAGLSAKLSEYDIPTARYYPKPIHMQTAYKDYPISGNGLPATEACRNHVISLPMHAYLDETTQDKVIEAVHGALKAV